MAGQVKHHQNAVVQGPCGSVLVEQPLEVPMRRIRFLFLVAQAVLESLEPRD
jgi:hypothetical protein